MIGSQSDLIQPFDDIIGFHFSMIFNAMSFLSFSFLSFSQHTVLRMIVEGTV